MHIPKRYLHDRQVLLLLTLNGFLTALVVANIALKLSGHAGLYVVERRANLGLAAFKTGGVQTFFAFMAFSLVLAVYHFVLSLKLYVIRRAAAIASLALGTLLLVLTLIVSNALLVAR